MSRGDGGADMVRERSHHAKVDTNKDGLVTREELRAV
jgi:hypothetical protein